MKQPARLGISILLRNGVLTDLPLTKKIFKGLRLLCEMFSVINFHQATLINQTKRKIRAGAMSFIHFFFFSLYLLFSSCLHTGVHAQTEDGSTNPIDRNEPPARLVCFVSHIYLLQSNHISPPPLSPFFFLRPFVSLSKHRTLKHYADHPGRLRRTRHLRQ